MGTNAETTMHTFTIRELRDHTDDLVRQAESGKLSVVTKHGLPVFVAVPFDEALLRASSLWLRSLWRTQVR